MASYRWIDGRKRPAFASPKKNDDVAAALTTQVRAIAEVATAVTKGDLSGSAPPVFAVRPAYFRADRNKQSVADARHRMPRQHRRSVHRSIHLRKTNLFAEPGLNGRQGDLIYFLQRDGRQPSRSGCRSFERRSRGKPDSIGLVIEGGTKAGVQPEFEVRHVCLGVVRGPRQASAFGALLLWSRWWVSLVGHAHRVDVATVACPAGYNLLPLGENARAGEI